MRTALRMNPLYRINKPVRLIELFGGIGTQAMVFRDLKQSFEHYRLIENNPASIASYNAIHGTSFEVSDIRSVSAEDIPIDDKDKYTYVMTYSYPCQSLSAAGRREGMEKGSGTESSLLWEVERLLSEMKEKGSLPQVLIMENVVQCHMNKNESVFNAWKIFLSKLGYNNFTHDMDALDYGLPQSRQRCFMVSILGKYDYVFPLPATPDSIDRDQLVDIIEDKVADNYYVAKETSDKLLASIERKMKSPVNVIIDDLYEGRPPRFSCYSPTLRSSRSGLKVVVAAERSRPKKGNDYSDTEQALEIQTKPISNTITSVTKDNLVIEKDNATLRVRRLTPLEYWRLMGFSDEDFHKAEQVSVGTALYEQAGNAIAKPVLRALVNNLY